MLHSYYSFQDLLLPIPVNSHSSQLAPTQIYAHFDSFSLTRADYMTVGLELSTGT